MIVYPDKFDVIVVGGGHAGTEAACASARMGAKTLLITHNIETIGQMSCNPAIGGIGKGHIVKEIDALGGVMAHAIDRAGIQFRILNSSKGPAVRATRAQADRALYKQAVRESVESQENLVIFQQPVDDLILETLNQTERVTGVITQSGIHFYAKAIVLTAGTFLGGKIHIGDQSYQAGRAGDPASITLSEKLRERPLQVGRLKTGTPPRLDKRSLDYSVMQAQPGDTPLPVFSYIGDVSQHPEQVDCHITFTNAQTHEIISQGLHRSAMYSGNIDGIGPRYCPSIEDKVVRFADKDSHQIFVEPEGLNNIEIYPNGLSTSLPFDVQLAYIRSIKGFENAIITRPGYAIEYDYFDPRGLHPTLETKAIEHLYFAGQINGTTGYEEAAGQGLIAGLNAVLKIQGKDAWYPKRNESYIGVMIDDLITLGTNEPYRMFTSRAEYRLLLREDNADLRLTEMGRKLGLIDEHRWVSFTNKAALIEKEQARLKAIWLVPAKTDKALVEKVLGAPLSSESNLLDLLKRPNIGYKDIQVLPEFEGGLDGSGIHDEQVIEQIEIQARYAGYIGRQQDEIERHLRNEETSLPAKLDYLQVKGLSAEVAQKLNDHQPASIGQASRISGITPAAISILLVYLKKSQAA